ncbi:hypothetical protein CW304_11085 [Bacillus sp. UFRGS-B20]|nr:hypothetical protein CW304_11085 [Bacillus sp. UFRGS-B20]
MSSKRFPDKWLDRSLTINKANNPSFISVFARMVHVTSIPSSGFVIRQIPCKFIARFLSSHHTEALPASPYISFSIS